MIVFNHQRKQQNNKRKGDKKMKKFLGLTWEEAIEKDWRKTKAWQPGWEYIIK